MTLAMSGIGCALLVQSARAQMGNANGEGSRWQSIQTQCLDKAHRMFRWKACPIDVRYAAEGGEVPPVIKVCLYSLDDFLYAVPVGGASQALGFRRFGGSEMTSV